MPILNRRIGRAMFRVVMITFLATLMSFAISLFLGIVTVLLVNTIRGGGLNMSIAYRHFAFPVALGVMAIAFVSALTVEIRESRRTRVRLGGLTKTA